MDDSHAAACGCHEYRELSRRQFITASAGASAVAFLPGWLPRITMAEHYSSSRDVIVSVFLRGGADGLTLCVPFADPHYYTARPTIAIGRPDGTKYTQSVALDNFFAFPLGMSPLLPAFQATDLLVVHAVGQLYSSRSHFDAQRFMEVGKPDDPTIISGWLGRHLASVPPMRAGSPLRALGISYGLQKTLVGAPQTLPIWDPSNFSIDGDPATQSARLSVIQSDYASAPEPLHGAALSAASTVALLKAVNFSGYTPANSAVYPNTDFGRGLRSVAALIKADVGIEAAQVDIGGWDTHANQTPRGGGMYSTMLELSNSLSAFWADVIGAGSYPVTVVAISEFGRNVAENGSGGTDHGRASVMLAMGKGIAGGRVLTVNWPGLAPDNLDSGQDLMVTLDYRDILAEIVQNRLGNSNLGVVFPSWSPTFRGVTR